MEKLFEFSSEYAKGYAEVGYDEDQIASVRDAFIDGAKWQKNHVWHKSSEKPNENQEILVEWEGYAGTLYHDIGIYDFDAFHFSDMPAKKLDSITRWGYIKDLL